MNAVLDALRHVTRDMAVTSELPVLFDSIASALLERAHIRCVCTAAGGRVHGANGVAELLGITPSMLRSHMQKLGH